MGLAARMIAESTFGDAIAIFYSCDSKIPSEVLTLVPRVSQSILYRSTTDQLQMMDAAPAMVSHSICPLHTASPVDSS